MDAYLHATWTCPQSTHSAILLYTDYELITLAILLSPALSLLEKCKTNHWMKYKKLVLISLFITKKMISKNWKSKQFALINQWHSDWYTQSFSLFLSTDLFTFYSMTFTLNRVTYNHTNKNTLLFPCFVCHPRFTIHSPPLYCNLYFFVS